MIFADAQSDAQVSIQAMHNASQTLIAQSASLHKQAAAAATSNPIAAPALNAQAAAIDAQIPGAMAAEMAAITAAKAAGYNITLDPDIITPQASVATADTMSGQTLLILAGVGVAGYFAWKAMNKKKPA